MRRIYGKIRAALMIACFFAIIAAGGCSGGEETDQSIISENVYKLGTQEVQIDLPGDFECTDQSDDSVVLSEMLEKSELNIKKKV